MQSDHSERIRGVLYGKRQAVKNILYICLKCTTEILVILLLGFIKIIFRGIQ